MRKIDNINQNWMFGKWLDGDMEKFPPNTLEKYAVELPHTWYEDGAQYHGIGVYERILNLEKGKGEKRFLEFQGADRWCKVYFNGVLLGEHKGGYSTFRVPIENDVIQDGENQITVVLDNRDWEEISPLSGDFTVYGGLYRNVFLITVPEQHFDLMYYGTCGILARADLDESNQGILKLETHLCGCKKENHIVYEIYNPDGKQIQQQDTSPEQESLLIYIEKPALWNGQSAPYLYHIVAKILTEDRKEVLDEVQIDFGFRKIHMDPDKGFFLNGQYLRIHGVAKHQDFADVFSAATPTEWDRDMELIKEIGANAIRLSHYQHPQYFYNLCDKEGIVVWAEIPMLKMNEKESCMENAYSQMQELIYQNLHHPSICFWGIQNEIAIFGENEMMYDNCQRFNRFVKKLDSSRFTTSANLYTVQNKSPLNHITDMVGYNVYFGWYYGIMQEYGSFLDQFHKECPNVPIGISEYGVDCSIGWHQEKPKVKDYSEEYQSKFHETVYAILQSKPYLWGSFVWNMFDFGSAIRNEGGVKYRNCKGLVTFDRKTKKDAFYYYKSQWSQIPFVHIAERRFEKRVSDEICVKVYSNQRTVTLETADLMMIKESDNGIFRFEHIPLSQERNLIVAKSGDCIDQVTFIKVQSPEESYTFVDPNPEINVRNWFLDEQEEEKLFPRDSWSIMDSIEDLIDSEEAMSVIRNWSEKLARAMEERKSAMPLYRVLNFMRKEFKEEAMKELNKTLNQIKKEPRK